jgi:hypothetical protein
MPITRPNCNFETTEPNLSTILDSIALGKIQLPDFQRGWVWDDNHIRSLIASVSLSYPIGAIMLLEMGGEGVRFRPRPVEGTSYSSNILPDRLILDGQQRLTSLFLILRSGKPVKTKTDKGEEIERVYFLDINKCLDENIDRIDAVISLPPDRRLTTDFGRQILIDVSTPEKEYELGMIPISIILNQILFANWRSSYQRLFRNDETRFNQFNNFETEIQHRFINYRIPTIELKKQTPKEAVCQVFEKVNTGGVTLTVFELLTATFAADDFNLRDDWDKRYQRLHKIEPVNELEATDFLTSLTLLSSYEKNLQGGPAVSCKRKDILNLTLNDYKTYADKLEESFSMAARFLTREKIFDTKNLPYTTQLIPLTAICTVLGKKFENDSIREKLARWYWNGVFGEMYGGANEGRFAFDLIEVINWIDGHGDEPRTIRDSNFAPVRLLSLQTRLSAAYKGLMVLLMQKGSKDFLNGDPIELTNYFDGAIDIHHIFPKAYCESCKYSKDHWNSIVNKAPLTARTNRLIRANAPSVYLNNIQKKYNLTPSQLDQILSSHGIIPEMMQKDDFNGFIRSRASALLDLIEKATGKHIAGRDSEETLTAFGGELPLRKLFAD